MNTPRATSEIAKEVISKTPCNTVWDFVAPIKQALDIERTARLEAEMELKNIRGNAVGNVIAGYLDKIDDLKSQIITIQKKRDESHANQEKEKFWCICTVSRPVENNQMCGLCKKPMKSLATNHEIVVAENAELLAEKKALVEENAKLKEVIKQLVHAASSADTRELDRLFKIAEELKI